MEAPYLPIAAACLALAPAVVNAQHYPSHEWR
jgi:hypothetical protein